MIIDTHTHLYLPEFDGDSSNAVKRALDAGVGHMIFPNVDISTIEPMQGLHSEFAHCTSMAMGLHPTEIKESWSDDLDAIYAELTSSENYVAVGEIGIDLYWDKAYEQQQMQAFERQIAWAQDRNMPIIVHCRDGLDQVLEVLQGFKDVQGVMHSFTGTTDDVERVRRVADMYFGINGIVTFKNSKLGESLQAIGLDRLLLETDSPYLAPVPHRGKRNESAYINYTAQSVADKLSIAKEVVAEATTSNANSLFKLNP